MAYEYSIQRASFQESEDPKELFVADDDFRQSLEVLAGEPSFAPWTSAFSYKDGRIDFAAEQWNPGEAGVTQAACVLAKQLDAPIFGEDDEEYSS